MSVNFSSSLSIGTSQQDILEGEIFTILISIFYADACFSDK